MEQNKKPIIIAVVVTVVVMLGLGAGGFFGYNQYKHSKKTVSFGMASFPSSGDSANANANSAASDTSSAGSLSVDGNSTAQQLGQLSGSNGSSNQGAQGSSSSSGSSTPTIDPSTFAQYDKYKDGKSVYFADVKVGTGAAVASGQKAAVYYKGWLTNGQIFDQSKPGSDGKLTPFIFTLGAHQVITGWEEGVAGMKIGGTRLLIVPPAVGYGASGQGSIPPNAVLVFEVQLLDAQ